MTAGRVLAGLVCGLLLLTACGATESDVAVAGGVTEGADEASGSDFPQFTADTVDGGQLDFGSLEGQDTLLWFWAPW